MGVATISRELADRSLSLLDVDRIGLDIMDRRYLDMVAINFGGGPVGINTIAASVGEEPETIEEVYEPYLMQLGFLDRTPRGRVGTERAFEYFQISRKGRPGAQSALF